MTMSKFKLKYIAAVVFAGCVLGLITLRFARATPPIGVSTTIIAGPTFLGEMKVKTQSNINKAEIETEGESDIYVVLNRVAPGGETGWHSHPGFSIVSVVAGEATNYSSDDPEGTVYEAGTAFVDEGGNHVHNVVNEGDTELVLVAFQMLPHGATRRIDRPAP
jgi:quercetin dioxygenase-like cupin family protein